MRKQKSEMMLMVFVQYLDTNEYVEQFLFCRLLAKNTTGKQRFKEHQLEWSDCVSVCTDGAPSMMGCKKGLYKFREKGK